MTGPPLAAIASRYLARLAQARGRLPPTWHFVLTLTEEAQEAADAWHRFTGWKRRRDTLAHIGEELADTVISAYVMAHVTGIDLDQAVADKAEQLMARDLREPP